MTTLKSNRESNDDHWKNAIDPASGKVYYYHELTRETRWRKPTCLVTRDERLAMEEKEQKEKDFFAAMEANILSSLSRGLVPGTPRGKVQSSQEQTSVVTESRKSLQNSPYRIDDDRPELIRTISAMDETVLTDIIRRQPSFRSVKSRQSLQFEDLIELQGRRVSMAVRDGLDLDTLDEGSGETVNGHDSTSSSIGYFPNDEAFSNNLLYDDSISSRIDGGSFDESCSTGFGLSLKETQALNKLVSLTKEMIDTNTEEELLDHDCHDADYRAKYSRNIQQSTEEEPRRVLPRELELDDSDSTLSTATQKRKDRAARMVANSEKPASDLLLPRTTRRNTCGTMYIRNTMSAPDKDGTIRCVCGVFRSHILSSENESVKKESNCFDVFNDYKLNQKYSDIIRNVIPSLDDVTTFFREIFFKAQMEADCIIMSLIYIERLIKVTHGRLRPKANNWRSILFSTMILSSKVWDDLSMLNLDFSQTCSSGINFSLKRTNQLELKVLNTLHYNVKVPASEYAKYYFLLRSMLIKSGLGGDDSSLNALDVEGARRLQEVSSQFESNSIKSAAIKQRSKSLATTSDYNSTHEHPKNKVGLEQVVKM